MTPRRPRRKSTRCATTARDPAVTLETAFSRRFDGELPEELNIGHRTVIVAGELDSETERIVNYLAETHGVPINARFFRLFRDGDREYLTRSWLIDPAAVEVKTEGKKRFGEWNGEYCGTFGGNEERRTLSRRFGPAEAARSG